MLAVSHVLSQTVIRSRRFQALILAPTLAVLLAPSSAVWAQDAASKNAAPKKDDAKAKAEPKAEAKPKSDAKDEKKAAKTKPAPKPERPKGGKFSLQDRVPADTAELSKIEEQVEKVVERVLPAVVGVRLGAAGGSAVIISRDGYVLSAAHVCGEAGRPVTFLFANGKTARGITLGLNKSIDAGMMKITDKGEWPAAAMAGPGSLALGDWVVALGHPNGFQRDRPPVVRIGRILRNLAGTLQTDCSLVGGDSGGPLFDLNGNVVGIHSRIGNQNINNYHVSIDVFWSDWDRMTSSDSWGVAFWQNNYNPPRPTPRPAPVLGVALEKSPKGLKIVGLSPNRPAEKAGLKSGDVLSKFDGVAVADEAAFNTKLEKCKVDQEVTLEILRGEKTLIFKMKLEALVKPTGGKKK